MSSASAYALPFASLVISVGTQQVRLNSEDLGILSVFGTAMAVLGNGRHQVTSESVITVMAPIALAVTFAEGFGNDTGFGEGLPCANGELAARGTAWGEIGKAAFCGFEFPNCDAWLFLCRASAFPFEG